MSRYHRSRGRSRLSASDGRDSGMTVTARIVGVEKTTAEFRAARREFNTKMRDVIVVAGERSVLPAIKSRFGSRRFGGSLYIKRDRTTVFIGSRARGSLNRAVGWFDFGGKRPRDRRPRIGQRVIVTELHGRRHMIDHEVHVALLQTFKPLETHP